MLEGKKQIIAAGGEETSVSQTRRKKLVCLRERERGEIRGLEQDGGNLVGRVGRKSSEEFLGG